METKKTLTIIPTARSFETAHKAENYPYGFRLKTTMFSWIEHTSRGARLVQQTINPKNGRLNEPKKSTYSKFLLLGLNDEGHVRVEGYSDYSSVEYIEEFLKDYSAFMTEQEIKDAQTTIKLKNYVSKKWQEREEQVKAKTYKPTEEIEKGQIILDKNLLDYAGEVDLWEIALCGNVIKPRARKESYERKAVAYIKRDGSLTEAEALATIAKLTQEVQEAVKQYKAHNFKLVFDEVTFKNDGPSMFHSVSRMLFSSTKHTFNL